MLATTHSRLQSIEEVEAAITGGKTLFLAGSREALSQLPRGSWVGGTICYFMTEEGGLVSDDKIFSTEVPEFALEAKAVNYGLGNLSYLYSDAPENGITFLIIPAATRLLKVFAEQAPSFDGFLMHPVVGWVSGVRMDRIGKEMPAVFNGQTGEVFENKAVALHVALPANKQAELEIVSIFKGGDGDVIHFKDEGFQAVGCTINGKPVNLADYIVAKGINTEFPLVGDYCGCPVNVSIQNVDPVTHCVELYAPVFPGVDYRFAEPVEDYAKAFAEVADADQTEPDFACNCVLNFIHGKLEGKKTGNVTGPITFGEIAHQLLNQTLVRMYLRDV
ncbi:MAG: hypothetical protein ABSF70_07925 [Terracidiphilus sp.]|jgi:hypothetical protein